MSSAISVDSVIENTTATVIGVSSNGTPIMFADADFVSRSAFLSAQASLATKYNLDFTMLNTTGK